jgi:hypothetical protein
MLAGVQSVPRECSVKRRDVHRPKPQVAWSEQVEDLSRVMSMSPIRDGISPSARAALLALIATLADLLGESPVAI